MSGFDQSSFIDALGEGVYGVDLDGMCIFVNRTALTLLGYESKDELVGRNMHHAIHHTRSDGSPFPQGDCPLIHTARTGRPVRLSGETLWRKDGTPIIAEYSSYPVRRGSDIIGSVITFVGTSERVEAERYLALQNSVSRILASATDSDSHLSRLLETIGLGFGWHLGIWWWDIEGASSSDDRLKCRKHWSTDNELSAGDLFALLDPTSADAGLVGEVIRTERQGVVTDLDKAVSSPRSTAVRSAGLQSEVVFPLMAGADLLGAIEFFSKTTIILNDACVDALKTLGQQIGQAYQRTRAVAAMLDSERRFRTIANTIPQLAWMAGPDGTINWYNQRWYDYTGTTPEVMFDIGWPALHHPDHLERAALRYKQAVAREEPWEDTFPLKGADGSYRWFLSRALPIRSHNPAAGGDSGAVTGWFGTNTDVTDMRESEQMLASTLEQAEAANRAKSTFLANMSHELRTPLSAIIGYTEMMIEEVGDGIAAPVLVPDMQKIEGNARHLLGLINNILDLSKVEAGKMDASPEVFDITALVREAASSVSTLMERKGNRLVFEIDDKLGTMYSDPVRVRQILLNLLGNSAKFTENGVITLKVARATEGTTSDWLTLSVADTGIGMSSEQVDKLFQRFQQADASTTRKYGGTGLGLALSEAFSNLLGGSISVQSTPGVGSVFTVCLPVELPTAHQAESEADKTEPEQGTRGLILVIDDDSTQRDLMSRFLRRNGYGVATAATGEAGLEQARLVQPRVILLDVTLPGIDGWSVLSALKADPALVSIPVVMVTHAAERVLASTLGAADYVMKPVDWRQMKRVMERFRKGPGDVLVVDDEPGSRGRLRKLLEREGWTVSEAVDGRQALDVVAHARPRLIILDLMMPVMDGFDFLVTLRNRAGCEDIPVVVLTAMDLTSAQKQTLQGANQILNKGDTHSTDLVQELRRIDGK